MKALVVYDTQYGNTEKLARAIGEAIPGEVKVVRAGAADPVDVVALDLLVVGSPTQGGRATEPVRDFLHGLSKNTVKGMKAAAFDTRIKAKWVTIFGYAAGKIAGRLKRKGAVVLASEGFFVSGKEDSILEGELERAAEWTKGLIKGDD